MKSSEPELIHSGTVMLPETDAMIDSIVDNREKDGALGSDHAE